MAEDDRSPTALEDRPAATEDDELPIPILAPSSRKELDVHDRPTIIRDFAYSADDPLFWRLEEPPDTPPVSGDEEVYADDPESDPTFDDPDGDGFKGAPPWMQSAHDGALFEEDHTSQLHEDEIHGRAVALFDFNPEHENEFALQEGQVIYVSSRHGLGWLVAVDINNGDCGLVPEEYVRLLEEDDEGFMDDELEPHEFAGQNYERRRSSATSQLAKKTRKLDESLETGDWEDEPEDASQEPGKQRQEGSGDTARSESELRAIMDAAEREMSLNEAKLRDA